MIILNGTQVSDMFRVLFKPTIINPIFAQQLTVLEGKCEPACCDFWMSPSQRLLHHIVIKKIAPKKHPYGFENP